MTVIGLPVTTLVGLPEITPLAAARDSPAGSDPLAATARQAIDGLRRGVVAYSSVA